MFSVSRLTREKSGGSWVLNVFSIELNFLFTKCFSVLGYKTVSPLIGMIKSFAESGFKFAAMFGFLIRTGFSVSFSSFVESTDSGCEG